MIPRLLAALGVLLSALTHARLSFAVMHLTVTVPIPQALLVLTGVALALFAWLLVRHLRTFKSSPYPRTRWSTA